MRKFYCDIETRARFNLKKTGVYRYVEDPDFDILMMSYAYDDDPVVCLTDPEQIEVLLWEVWHEAVRGDAQFVAHNAQFERVCFSTILWGVGKPEVPSYAIKYDHPEHYDDTMARAAGNGLPKKLEYLAKALGVTEKDKAGTHLINLFSKPNRKGEFNNSETHPEKWQEFMRYCDQDVETLREIDRAMAPWQPGERDVWLADQVINDRGVRVDVDFARAASEMAQDNREKDILRMRDITGLENPNSVQQLLGWLHEKEVNIESLRKDDVEEALGTVLAPEAREVLQLRQSTALTASKKYDALLGAVCDDGRLRGTLSYGGAGNTMRWSGRIFQPQNIPGGDLGTDAEIEGKIIDVKMGEPHTQSQLKVLVRPALQGPFCVADFSAIEARVTAYLAGEEWVLDTFREGKDLYVQTASMMYGVSYEDAFAYRKNGKVAVLALGFAGGTGALEAFNAPGTKRDLQDMVDRYRASVPKIAKFWSDVENAFIKGGKVGELTFHKGGPGVRKIVLPSGRSIIFRGCRASRPNEFGRVTLSADHVDGMGGRRKLWKGTITENIVQAFARDLMANAILNLEADGLKTVLTVHDEAIVEAPESDLERVTAAMVKPPGWLDDSFPLAADGYFCARYTKR